MLHYKFTQWKADWILKVAYFIHKKEERYILKTKPFLRFFLKQGRDISKEIDLHLVKFKVCNVSTYAHHYTLITKKNKSK